MTAPPARLVLIIGGGRSGTHWLASILAAVDETTVTVETTPPFPNVVRLAIKPAAMPQLYPTLVHEYLDIQKQIRTPIWVDKSHPAMWLAESCRKRRKW